MSIEKSELKIMVTNDLGEGIANKIDSARRTVYQLEGAVQVLQLAAKKIPYQLCAKVDVLELEPDMTEIQIKSLVKKYLTKCGDFLDHLAEVEKIKITAQQGEVIGLESALGVVKKVRDKEIQDVQDLVAYMDKAKNNPEKGDRASRPKGAHPGPSSLAERRAEGKKDKEIKLETKETETEPVNEIVLDGPINEIVETKQVKGIIQGNINSEGVKLKVNGSKKQSKNKKANGIANKSITV